jgi:hypothetical protein
MPRWPRPPNLLRLLVGQHIVNGVSVGVGVIAIAIVASGRFADLASSHRRVENCPPVRG